MIQRTYILLFYKLNFTFTFTLIDFYSLFLGSFYFLILIR